RRDDHRVPGRPAAQPDLVQRRQPPASGSALDRLPAHPAPRRGRLAGRRPGDYPPQEAHMALMFLNGDGMRGGRAHYTIEGVPLIGERRTAPIYRVFSVRDEFPALYPVSDEGGPVLGELYDVPMGPLSALLATEPPELELSIIELEG